MFERVLVWWELRAWGWRGSGERGVAGGAVMAGPMTVSHQGRRRLGSGQYTTGVSES
ncbi:hypothetical protein KHQ06_23825 [Nocardia tengchongensis]|uniref:Uncharacterized protein n=1 Tax=Nocardia tengchongensis TaxID=2055889 RepID=A0ABX8CHH1_9NOCA|nr:hypothetical protein [Nocardia tengchongensis]QVI19414.1 hypothetical protein KHQ06_23825 [Nocardia tengchongensis]